MRAKRMTLSNELKFNGVNVKLAWFKWFVEIVVLVGGLMWGFQSLKADVKILDGRMQSVEHKMERVETRLDQHMQVRP